MIPKCFFFSVINYLVTHRYDAVFFSKNCTACIVIHLLVINHLQCSMCIYVLCNLLLSVCTRLLIMDQLSQQNTESTQKTILSVSSWAGDAYHWQLRAMEPGVQRRRRPSHRWLLV